MAYIVYETTNLVNGKKYRGCHSGNDDSYFGSGKLLHKAIEKYGVENFKRVTLEEAETSEEMYEIERRLVNQEWIDSPDTYNLKLGGEGGWDYVIKSGVRWTPEKTAKHVELCKTKNHFWPHKPTKGFTGRSHSDTVKGRISSNNAMTLDKETVERRKSEWNSLPDVRGRVLKAAKLWGVSHTTVKRFVKKYC